jgi:hypothetical protein
VRWTARRGAHAIGGRCRPGRRARAVSRALALAGVAALALAAALPWPFPAGASEVLDPARPAGHPRDRFPLAVYLEPSGDPNLAGPVRQAAADWNAVLAEGLGIVGFRWHDREEGADVVIRFGPGSAEGPFGSTRLETDAAGVIRLPVHIELAEPVARGETSRETVLFQVAAHELGHALGLPHAADPASIMCCIAGAVALDDPAVRARYVAARRRPEVRSALAQLLTLYPGFWGPAR